MEGCWWYMKRGSEYKESNMLGVGALLLNDGRIIAE
jgi:hypothetical protein